MAKRLKTTIAKRARAEKVPAHGIPSAEIETPRVRSHWETIWRNRPPWPILVGGVVAVALLPMVFTPPDVLVTATARTELFEYTPTNPQAAEIAFPRARIDSGRGRQRCLGDLRIQLWGREAVSSTFRRYQDHPSKLEVTFSDPVTAEFSGGSVEIPQGAVLIVDGDDAGCRPVRPFRIPLLGRLQIGGSDSVDVLRSIVVKVYGRAGERLFGLPVRLLGSLEPNALYLADVVELPTGSRILCAAVRRGSPNQDDVAPDCIREHMPASSKRETNWWGFTDVDLTQSEPGLSLELASNAHYVLFSSPAPPTAGPRQPDIISLSLLARLLGDPNLRLAAAAVLGLITLVTGLAQIAQGRRRR